MGAGEFVVRNARLGVDTDLLLSPFDTSTDGALQLPHESSGRFGFHVGLDVPLDYGFTLSGLFDYGNADFSRAVKGGPNSEFTQHLVALKFLAYWAIPEIGQKRTPYEWGVMTGLGWNHYMLRGDKVDGGYGDYMELDVDHDTGAFELGLYAFQRVLELGYRLDFSGESTKPSYRLSDIIEGEQKTTVGMEGQGSTAGQLFARVNLWRMGVLIYDAASGGSPSEPDRAVVRPDVPAVEAVPPESAKDQALGKLTAIARAVLKGANSLSGKVNAAVAKANEAVGSATPQIGSGAVAQARTNLLLSWDTIASAKTEYEALLAKAREAASIAQPYASDAEIQAPKDQILSAAAQAIRDINEAIAKHNVAVEAYNSKKGSADALQKIEYLETTPPEFKGSAIPEAPARRTRPARRMPPAKRDYAALATGATTDAESKATLAKTKFESKNYTAAISAAKAALTSVKRARVRIRLATIRRSTSVLNVADKTALESRLSTAEAKAKDFLSKAQATARKLAAPAPAEPAPAPVEAVPAPAEPAPAPVEAVPAPERRRVIIGGEKPDQASPEPEEGGGDDDVSR